MIEAVSRPPMSGTSSRPELLAEAPLATWRKVGRYVMAPNMAMPTMKLTRGGHVERPQPEQPQRDGGLGRPPLDQHEQHGADDRGGRPRPRITGEPQGYSLPPQVVSSTRQVIEVASSRVPSQSMRTLRRRPVRGQHDAGHEEGDEAEGQVDVEDPAPGEVVGEEAAEQGPGHAGGAEHGPEVALVAAALPGADDVGDDRLGQHDEPTGADALDRPEGDELAHRGGETGQDAADDEDHDGATGTAACARSRSPSLPNRRRRDRLGQQVRGDDPRQVARGRRGRPRWWAGRWPRWSGRWPRAACPSMSPEKMTRTWRRGSVSMCAYLCACG